VTRDRTICIRDKSKAAAFAEPKPLPKETSAGMEVDSVQLRPCEIILKAGESQAFEVHAFDANGRLIKVETAPNLKVGDSLKGLTADGGALSCPAELAAGVAGTITAEFEGKTASARVRVFNPAKVWKWDFDGYKAVQVPPTWCRAHIKIKPFELDGNTVMKVTGGSKIKGRPSHHVSIGPPDMKNYTLQADVQMTMQRRQLASVGLSANRYDLYLKGNKNQLQVRSWAPHLRMAETMKYRCDPKVWYTMKMRVETTDDEATIYGKVWKRDEEEPGDWTIVAKDPNPNQNGSPGLIYYAQADCFFDNVILTKD